MDIKLVNAINEHKANYPDAGISGVGYHEFRYAVVDMTNHAGQYAMMINRAMGVEHEKTN